MINLSVKKRIFFISALLLATVFDANSQATAPAALAPPTNIVHLGATGVVEVQQDTLTVTLRATKDGVDAAAVQAHLKLVLDGALQEGRAVARAGQLSIRSGALGLNPRYGKDSKIVGWQGTADVVLEGRDLVNISQLSGRIQGMNIAALQFGLSEAERALAQAAAQSLAITSFKLKADSITRQFGLTSYTLRDIAVSAGDGNQPRAQMPMPMQMQMRSVESDAPVPLEAGRATLSVSVNGSIQMH